MDLCTKLSDEVLDLETTKTAQAKEIANLKKRVNKLEKRKRSRTPGMNLFKIGTSRRKSLGEEDASKHGRNLKQGKQSLIFEESDFDDEDFDADMDEVFKDVEGDAEQVISAAADEVPTGNTVNTAGTEVNTVSALVTTAGVSVSTAEPITPPITTTIFEDEDLIIAQTLMKMKSEKSKVRGVVMQEPSETATRPTVPPQQHDPKDKAELEEEERRAKQREEDANIFEWNDVQAMIDADYELAVRLQAQEQEELTIEERSKLFVEIMNKRKKHFARLIAEEQRRKPPTKAQKRNQMCTYLKNIAGFTHNQLKNKSFDEREGEDLQQESTKKQKMDDDKEKEDLKQCFEIIPNDGDDVTIDATPFKMLKNFDREYLEVLWRIVKARFKKTWLVDYMDTFLHLNLKTMFEHHVEDSIWKNQQGLVKVLNWKLFDSCGVHCVTMQSIPYYLLVEKMYPLTKHTLHQMFDNVKL
ncbi:hypothetical protein Tco_0553889 [Tanacetum coccineum]